MICCQFLHHQYDPSVPCSDAYRLRVAAEIELRSFAQAAQTETQRAYDSHVDAARAAWKGEHGDAAQGWFLRLRS